MERRKTIGRSYSGNNIFASKLICGDCGSVYGRKLWHSTDKYRKTIWQCNKKFKTTEKCRTPNLDEEVIKEAFIKTYNQIAVNKDSVIEGCELMISALVNFDELQHEIDEQTEVVSILVERANKLINDNSSKVLSQNEYQAKYNQLVSKYEEENAKLEKLQKEKEHRLNQKRELDVFMDLLKNSPQVITEWNESVFNMMIDKSVIHKDETIEFYFIDDSKVEIEL